MENKINNDKNLTHECNVLYNILNTMKCAKSKIVITHKYYRFVWTPVVEEQNLEIFESYWTAEAIQQLWWVSWRQNSKKKINRDNYVGNPSNEVNDLKEGERRFLSAII